MCHASGSRLPCGCSCSKKPRWATLCCGARNRSSMFCRFPAAQPALLAPLPLPHSQGQEGRCPALLQPQARRQAGQRLHAHRLPGGEGRQVDRCGRLACFTAAERCVWGLHTHWLSAMGSKGAEGDALSCCSARLCILNCSHSSVIRRAYCFSYRSDKMDSYAALPAGPDWQGARGEGKPGQGEGAKQHN